MKAKSCRSDIAGSVHQMMRDAHDTGVVSRETLRRFDDACRTPRPAARRRNPRTS